MINQDSIPIISPDAIAHEIFLRECQWIDARVREILGEYWWEKALKKNFFWNLIIKRKFKITIRRHTYDTEIEILLNGKVYSTYSTTLINNLKK